MDSRPLGGLTMQGWHFDFDHNFTMLGVWLERSLQSA